jgi:hypothetical protein
VPENDNYIGCIPEKKYFAPELFNESKKKEFEKWYDENKNIVYDFKKELYEYCVSDVKLLKEGCIKFRNIIKKTTTIDPFETNITIASLCHHIYRTKLMKPDTIGLIPEKG